MSVPRSRLAYSVALAMVCALAVVDLLAGGPAARSAAAPHEAASVTVADALGIDGSGVEAPTTEDSALLGRLAASRAQRDTEQAAAGAAQAQAEQAAAAARAEAEAQAAAAASQAAAEAAAASQVADASKAGTPATAAASTAASAVARIGNSAGAVRPQSQAAANAVVSNVPGADGITIGGTRASAGDPGGHPSGLALDYMSTVALGEAIVAYHVAHWGELGVEYIIWQQRILMSPSGSWRQMEDRGSPTANHMDHVHVNYLG